MKKTCVLSHAEIKKQMREKGDVEGVVTVDLDDIISYSYDGFLDLLSEGLVGDELLMDIHYTLVSCNLQNETLDFEVTGEYAFGMDEEDNE